MDAFPTKLVFSMKLTKLVEEHENRGFVSQEQGRKFECEQCDKLSKSQTGRGRPSRGCQIRKKHCQISKEIAERRRG